MSKNYLRKKVSDFFIKKKFTKVKDVLDSNLYPPIFEPEIWNRGKRGYNCYAYVLDVPVRDRLKQIWYPGFFCGNFGEIYSTKTLIENVKLDLKSLGFSYREEDGFLFKGEYRIAIYYIPSFHDMPIGFHMVRQDEDGSWSEKSSWRSSVKVIKSKSDVPPDLSKYQVRFCKTLVVKKN